MPLLPHTSEAEAIVGIQFGVFSPEEILRRSVCEVTSPSTAEGKLNGLFDPRMGVLENGKVCRSCGQNNHNCPGHFGHFVLARPVYYTQFFKYLMKVLRCVCFKCGKLLIDKQRNAHLLKLKGESRWKMVLTAAIGTTRCGEDTEDGCGSRQPTKYKEEPVHKIFAEWNWKKGTLPEGVEAPEGSMDASGDVKISMPLEPEYVHRLLRRVTDEDVEFMGFSRHWCRPDWMMCTVLPIPPPQVRPSVTQDNNQRSEDDLTSKLIDIIKANSALKKKITDDPKKRAIDEWTNLLQYHVATLVDNNIPGISPAAQRSGRLLKSLQQRLGSKEGRIRSNLQGKRVEYSARSVITPDPNISVKELGIPMKIAMNLTYPEMVTAFNIGKLYKLIQNGPDVYPGAKTIQRGNGRTISLKHVNAKTIELFEGDTVNRHLMDGDVVLFNRQPSLHRMSMMAHIAKILPYNTFRLNVFVTAPYNADFDGDEMNLHAPQSIEAATELREIAAVPLQIVSPRESVPIVSVVQDTLVGANRFTRPNVMFNKKEAMNLLVHAKRWDGILPPPIKTEPQEMWSGQQLLSALLPPVSLQMKNNSYSDADGKENNQNLVKIYNGQIQQGILDKAVFSKQLLHIIYNDYGPDITIDFLDSLQSMIASFLMNSGFSVGISDLIADEATNKEIGEALSKLTKTIEDQILQVHTGLFENSSGRTNQEEFEAKLMSTLNKAVGEAGKIGLKSLADTNRMTNMIKAGSKGSDVNVSQMVATLGQQAIEGKRVPNGFQHRTLPHFKRFDDSAKARGFISSNYIKGLQPDEFFFHAMSGREGLIDTAVKTADTGYMQRQIRVALEDLITQHDGSVRDAAGNILQLSYGEDGINATKLESQPLPLKDLSDEDIRQRFAAPGADEATYIKAVMEDRRILVENIFLNKPQTNVRYPVHLDRLIHVIRTNFHLGENGTVTATEVLNAQKTILNRTHAHNKLWGALIRYYLSPLNLKQLGYTPVALDALAEQIVLKHWKSWVEPGQPVGVIAAQSIGEPATQMTLNTFHLAGVAAKSNMTRGVPRLKELLKATRNPKAVELTIPLRKDIRNKKEEARRVAQELEFTLLQDIVTVARIYYDPRDADTLITEDADWLAYLAAYELATNTEKNEAVAHDELSESGPKSETTSKSASPWILRLELDRERMFTKNITMDDIAFIMRSKFSSELTTIFSDYNATRLVIRARLSSENRDPHTTDDLNSLKILQNKILSGTIVRGVPGLRTVNYQKISDIVEFKDGKYQPMDQYVLVSDGSNFLDVMNHPDVDASRVVSSNVHDMFQNLGIEAARATIYKEITTLFQESGSGVNYRHVSVLLDKMCHKGRTMSIDRYGINKNDIGPLAKMSFEQTEDIALRAAVFGERDPVLGVSAKVMLGAPIKAGTAFSELLMDEVRAIELMESTPEQNERVSSGPGKYTQEELDSTIYSEDTGECSTKELRLNVPMPSAPMNTVMEEEDEVDIAILDE